MTTEPALDEEHCYRAVSGRDARFDGWIYVGVLTTGIYCRPSCPAVTPKRRNVRFYAAAAAAQAAGFRACRRCRPDAVPGSPEWNTRADAVARAMRLIADGVVEREGVPGLARRLGYSERHLHRLLLAELGAGPLALARAQRAHTARLLIETTAIPFGDVAFGSGFASIRQFNDTVRTVFAMTPTQLRRSARAGIRPARGELTLRLPYRAPFDGGGVLAFLAARAVPGLEECDSTTYRRTLRLPHGHGVVALSPAAGHVACRLGLDDLRDLGTAVQRCRRLLDLDADPVAVWDCLGSDSALGNIARDRPGLRVPGCTDPEELAVRAVLGQQVSVAGARALAARLVRAAGTPLAETDGTLTHVFPAPAAIAAAPDGVLAMPVARRRAVTGLAAAIAEQRVALDPGVDRSESEQQLRALPGIGPWTASYIRMRALGDPDVFLPTDLGVRKALALNGVPVEVADRWRPWRSYAVMQLWAQLGAPATPSGKLS